MGRADGGGGNSLLDVLDDGWEDGGWGRTTAGRWCA